MRCYLREIRQPRALVRKMGPSKISLRRSDPTKQAHYLTDSVSIKRIGIRPTMAWSPGMSWNPGVIATAPDLE